MAHIPGLESTYRRRGLADLSVRACLEHRVRPAARLSGSAHETGWWAGLRSRIRARVVFRCCCAYTGVCGFDPGAVGGRNSCVDPIAGDPRHYQSHPNPRRFGARYCQAEPDSCPDAGW